MKDVERSIMCLIELQKDKRDIMGTIQYSKRGKAGIFKID